MERWVLLWDYVTGPFYLEPSIKVNKNMPIHSVPIIINWGLKGTPNWFSSFSTKLWSSNFIIFAVRTQQKMMKWWWSVMFTCSLRPHRESCEMKNKYLTDHKLELERNKNRRKNRNELWWKFGDERGSKSQSSTRTFAMNIEHNLTALRHFELDVNLDIKKSNKFFVIKITFMCVAP